MLSKCCKAELETSCGEEGTNCFVCLHCKKACDLLFESYSASRSTSDYKLGRDKEMGKVHLTKTQKFFIRKLNLDLWLNDRLKNIQQKVNELNELKTKLEHGEDVKSDCFQIKTDGFVLCQHGRLKMKNITLKRQEK